MANLTQIPDECFPDPFCTPEEAEIAEANYAAFIQVCERYNNDLEAEEEKRDAYYVEQHMRQIDAAESYRANFYSSHP